VGWSSVLREDLRVIAQDRLSALITANTLSDTSGSASELCDRALLSAYHGRCEADVSAYVHAVEYLNAAAERVSNRLPSGAFEGLSAIGWNTEHLRLMLDAVGVVASDTDEPADPLQELEQLLLLRLRAGLWLGPYDFISGLSGIALFFLERLPLATAREGISLVVDQLEALAERTDCAITWFTPARLVPESQRDQAPDGYYNLGVAHGVPAVIYILCEIGAVGIERPRVERLVDDAVRWLLAQQRVSPDPLRYPNWIVPNRPPGPSRLAWCYGDLGIAAVLHHVARRLERPELRQSALDAFERCLMRFHDCPEPTLCHGALGIAHIFNRVYQREGDARFLEAANRYYQLGLSLLEARPTHDTGDDSSRPRSSEFLQGDVGSALALLAALHPVEPDWDRRLLISGGRVSTLAR
jgi:hypothetical protein